jgi:hypothetical protein
MGDPSMTGMRLGWLTLFVAFAALNVWALATVGWDGVVAYFTTMGPIELVAAVDLVLALLIGVVLVVRNAHERSLRSGPFVLLTLVAGSLGLLAYLARHDVADPAPSSTTGSA